ncbi:MAG TPA: homoserine kinase [Methylotenera sp.]|nr:homoserine kinase [Methylotenera sp.]
MSVFTTVTQQELSTWLQNYSIGTLVELKGISSGITNTNYFVTTQSNDGTRSKYVLTLFEQNNIEDLPYFIDLMSHLSTHGIPCPKPVADGQGVCLGVLNGKPAALVSCLLGQDVQQPNLAQCAEVGRVLAKMHLAGQTFEAQFPQHFQLGNAIHNQRDADWRQATAQKVMPKLKVEEQQLLHAELDYQRDLAIVALPHGVVHGDLFRDNVLFDGDKLGGFIDFYYACHDSLAYDVAIAVNDWCILANGQFDEEKLAAFLAAYQTVRPFNEAECLSWHALLRRAALRFWLSRLYDFHFPAEGELTHAKDPNHFKQLLQLRIALQASAAKIKEV